MNKRVLSSTFGSSRAQIFLQQQIQLMQKEHQKRQIQHLKKQNKLLKKQLQQLKQVYSQAKKQLNLYRGIIHTQYTGKEQFDNHMDEIFQMQRKKIFDLETDVQVMREKYNRSVLNSGSVRQTQYAVKCKELEKRLQKSQGQYQRQISNLRQKLTKFNASELIMQKSRSSNFMLNSNSELKPLSGKFYREQKLQ